MNNKEKSILFKSCFMFVLMLSIIIVGNIILKIRIEMLMIISSGFALIVATGNDLKWKDYEEEICNKIKKATPAILIIWSIGIIIASFMFSGSIPMIIYYGLKIINPKYLYVCSFLLCTILSLATGTSWGSAATGGVAMMGIAIGFNIPLNITAAAIISGCLVGDKLSPLSDTTNIAPMAAGINIYDHIRSMLWTTIPASIISLTIFFVLGSTLNISSTESLQMTDSMLLNLDNIYNWNILLLLPFIILITAALLKFPTVPSMIISSFVALLLGCFSQGFNVVDGINSCINGFTVNTIYNGEVTNDIATLLNRGGMKSMVGIIIIVYCGYIFVSIADKAGFISAISNPLKKLIKSKLSLVVVTLILNFFISACIGSTYAAFIIVGEMLQDRYKDMDVSLKVLSRSMEDSGTMMLPLVPWSAASVFYVSTLGVDLFGINGYGIWCFNTFLNPIIAIVIATFGIGMYKKESFRKKV